MSDCTERSEGQERMRKGRRRMSDCTERSEGQERMRKAGSA
jgi:hypothetical protein